MNEATELRDLKPLEPYGPQDHGSLAGAALLGAALLCAGVLAALRRRNRRPASPERAAARTLALLGANARIPDAAFYRELTSVLRSFLQARFRIPASTLTVGELEKRLLTLPLPEGLREDLSGLLRRADAIAYGGQPVQPSLRVAHLNLVRRFVDLPVPNPVRRRAAA